MTTSDDGYRSTKLPVVMAITIQGDTDSAEDLFTVGKLVVFRVVRADYGWPVLVQLELQEQTGPET